MANEFRIKNGLIVDQGTSQITGSLLVSGSQTLTGSLNVSAGITGSLFGTSSNIQGGTVNYIPIWNAATSISSSVLYQSASNVGIGTTAPGAKLDVSGSDAAINGVRVGRGAGNIAGNTAIGSQSLASNTTGDNNTAVGRLTLRSNTTGYGNTAVGIQTLATNLTGYSNTAIGDSVLYSNTTGASNVGVGVGVLVTNSVGSYNTAVGPAALQNNTSGSSNTAIGFNSLTSNSTGYNNTAVGSSAGLALTTGFRNTFLGDYAGSSATTSQYSTVIGGYLTPGNSTFNDNQTLSIEKPNTAVNAYIGESAGLPHIWAPETGYVGDGGTGTMLQLESTVYSAFFMDYNIEDDNGNMRAGTIRAIWKADGSSINWTEEATDSIGNTSGIVISVTYGSGYIYVNFDNNNGYGAYYNLTSRLLIRPRIGSY